MKTIGDKSPSELMEMSSEDLLVMASEQVSDMTAGDGHNTQALLGIYLLLLAIYKKMPVEPETSVTPV